MFEEEFDKLSHGDQAQFKRVVNALLYKCYLVRRTYDRATKINKISPDYLFVERHFDLISDYVTYMDMDLVKDDDNGVCFLTSEDDLNKIRVDGITTLVVYALRSYYEDRLHDNPANNEVYIDSVSLKILMKDLGLTTVSRRISSVSIAASLRMLSMYNIICIAKGSFSEQTYAFYILPSIRYIISNAKLNALYNSINTINNVDGTGDANSLFSEVNDDNDSNSSAPQADNDSSITDKGDNN